jgi:hypothetical protein
MALALSMGFWWQAIRLPCWLQIPLFWKRMEYVWIRRVIHGGILYAFIFIWVTEVYWCLFSLFFVRVSKICLTCTWQNFNLSFLVLEASRTCGSTARFLLVVMHIMHGLHNRPIDSLLVGALEHEFYALPFSWEFHHPNWLSHDHR